MAYQRGFPTSGVISDKNKTTTPLSAGATYTGAPDDVREYAEITVFLYTDQGSAIDGLSLQFSTNAINWDDKTEVNVTGQFVSKKILPVVAQYFRVVYTNGSVAQSEFRLQVIYNRSKNKDITSSADGTIGDDSDATLTRSIITGKDQNGVYQNAGVTIGNRLQTESRDTDTYPIFNAMFKELRKINLHLSLMTDTDIQNKDLM
jgi:hypothetical protein